jgi:hypothetical protein
MSNQLGPLKADSQFFAALLEGSAATLDALLADEFILIDVMRGSEVARGTLLEALQAGQLKFAAIDLIESRVRQWGKAAVVTGRTRMSISLGETSVTANSRYTHVYINEPGGWQLVSAQGTQIIEE